MSTIRVAVDGPSGAGKSTLARAAAAALGFLYVDTGAIYRTVGLSVRDRGVDPGDEAAVAEMLPPLRIELRYDGEGGQRMFLNGRDVSGEIRLPEISRYASAVSALPVVRAYLMETQRDLARKHDVIMDGRDIGTVVLPDAEVKVFLTASAQARAERRCRELEERGTPQPFEEVLRDIEDRDFRDTHREAAPLRRAEDAALLDTSALDFRQSLEALLEIIRERTGL
ncbi:(d)CMP kinase [Oscillibacter sp.]|jgi:cytidylate kinase|uniref:(d)CMP kinase n=1 Tax=Oscillibacter sp. TaxID=1945593 RepID=UPI0021748660|nr:(d)CMP kinase [Oscillibacter sp.]MCI9112678.1 (d)CMP kinase [Oscillibacter sp.]MCI9300325.1 (d)CMP kinase [Oscillibacter sp.]MCI9461489.1 (d)CMP kinase [Oscillibacter sp.]